MDSTNIETMRHEEEIRAIITPVECFVECCFEPLQWLQVLDMHLHTPDTAKKTNSLGEYSGMENVNVAMKQQQKIQTKNFSFLYI